jgi:hypothetical protein
MTAPAASAVEWQHAIAAATTSMSESTLAVGEQPPSTAAAIPPMPWTIGTHGREWLASPSGAIVGSLASSGAQFVATPDGAALAKQVATVSWKSAPDATLAAQVESSGIFSGSLDQIRADALLRSFSVGGGGGAQVLVGGEGGGGYVWDMAGSDTGGYAFGLGKLGIGGDVGAGLLLGAWTRPPSGMQGSITALQLGVSMGAGAFVTVVMDDQMNLAGFTVEVGVGAGVGVSVGYGSLSVT